MSSPDLTATEIEAVSQVLQTPYLSLGPRIAEFEQHFAAYAGACHAVGVSSGTTGRVVQFPTISPLLCHSEERSDEESHFATGFSGHK